MPQLCTLQEDLYKTLQLDPSDVNTVKPRHYLGLIAIMKRNLLLMSAIPPRSRIDALKSLRWEAVLIRRWTQMMRFLRYRRSQSTQLLRKQNTKIRMNRHLRYTQILLLRGRRHSAPMHHRERLSGGPRSKTQALRYISATHERRWRQPRQVVRI